MTAGMCLNVHSNSHIEYNSQTIGRPQQTKENHVNNSGEAIFPNKQKMTKMDKKKLHSTGNVCCATQMMCKINIWLILSDTLGFNSGKKIRLSCGVMGERLTHRENQSQGS